MRFPAAVMLLAAVPFASAACPVAGDLQTGIKLLFKDGAEEVYLSVSDAVVQQNTSYPDGYMAQNLFGQGLHLLQLADLEGGQITNVLRFGYGVAPEELPVPEPGGSWQAEVAVLSGFDADTEQHSHTYGALTEVTIGTCSYAAIPVTIRYTGVDPAYTEQITYLRDLGFGYLTSYQNDGEPADTYSVTGIEKVAP